MRQRKLRRLPRLRSGAPTGCERDRLLLTSNLLLEELETLHRVKRRVNDLLSTVETLTAANSFPLT